MRHGRSAGDGPLALGELSARALAREAVALEPQAAPARPSLTDALVSNPDRGGNGHSDARVFALEELRARASRQPTLAEEQAVADVFCSLL